jgi:hypothetical protein
LSSVQSEAFCDLSSDFDHNDLDNEGQNGNENENPVSENAGEDVEFT